MDKNLQSRVEAIATDVRYWAEGKCGYSHTNLMGWCARASAQLFKQLEKDGIAAEIHAWTCPLSGCAHVFVVVDDHVVDVTATQFMDFENTPVVIMHYKEAQAHDFYQGQNVFNSVKKLRSWQKENRWPAHQMAYR